MTDFIAVLALPADEAGARRLFLHITLPPDKDTILSQLTEALIPVAFIDLRKGIVAFCQHMNNTWGWLYLKDSVPEAEDLTWIYLHRAKVYYETRKGQKPVINWLAAGNPFPRKAIPLGVVGYVEGLPDPVIIYSNGVQHSEMAVAAYMSVTAGVPFELFQVPEQNNQEEE